MGRTAPVRVTIPSDVMRARRWTLLDLESKTLMCFAHVLRGVYGVDSLWLEQSKISLLRDIGSIVADSYNHIKP